MIAGNRLIFVFACFLIWIIVCIGALYVHQIQKGEAYRLRADRQYVNPTEGQWNRGNMYAETKDGERIALATVQDGISIVAVREQIVNKESVADMIAPMIEATSTDVLEKLSNGKSQTVELGRFIPGAEGFTVPATTTTGIRFLKFRERLYPQGTSTSHLIGFVGQSQEDGKLAGRYGAERYFEATLSREPVAVYKNVFEDLFHNVQDLFTENGEVKGDIVLTIEPRVQTILERQLESAFSVYEPEFISGVIIDPKTGDVLAMGSVPTFDPNEYGKYPLGIFQNPLTEKVFELGSIIKPLTIAAGIDSGKIKPNTRYYDEGSVVIDGRTISNFDKKERGWVTMQDVMDESLNTGVIHAVKTMGEDVFRAYFEAYKLGERTGIELPSEAKGLVQNLTTGRLVDSATASFGQGIALTPIAAIRALGALANDGVMVEPRILKRVITLDGQEIPRPIASTTRVMKTETAEAVTKMMVHAVDNALVLGTYKMDNLSVAAKTGTAQVPDPRGGYSDQVLHTFVGYFPAYDPQYFIFLIMKDPKGENSDFASQTLTRFFFRLVKGVVEYYGVQGDR